MIEQKTKVSDKGRSESGRTLIEMAIVVALIIIVSVVAIPQLISSRRLQRAAGMGREVSTQLRYARQLAMSRRKAITFQYDDSTKEISIIQHNKVYDPDGVANSGDETRVGKLVVADSNYPMTTGATVLRTVSLTSAGIPAADIIFGKPSGASSAALGDNTNLPSPVPTAVQITFQPDGSVINSSGNIKDSAIFLYNNLDAKNTALAISVLGAAGRVKIWRYNSSATTYAE